MSEDQQEKSLFGSVQPRRRSRGAKLWFTLLLFCFAVFLPITYYGFGDFYKNIIERDAPVIQIVTPPVGLGLEAVDVAFKFSDPGAGLDEVLVKLEQAGKERVVFEKSYTTRVRVDDITVNLEGKKYGIKEGEARLMLSAFDKSFWSNGSRSSVQLRVDYSRPEISVFTDQHNAVLGGAEFVFYRVKERGESFSGVTVGSQLLPGFPAKNFDKGFDGISDLYCALFPVPRDFDSSTGQIKLFARDAVGNMGTAPLSYHIQNQTGRQTVTVLTRETLQPKLDELYGQLTARRARQGGQPVEEMGPSESDEEIVRRFGLVSGEYREINERVLGKLFAKPKAEKFWDGIFARYSAKELHTFGERISYQYNQAEIGTSIEKGVTWALPAESDVKATNRGVVIFAAELGTYGNTVIVDHGFGLTTVYSHLSKPLRLEGDRVERGEVIGKSGDSGLVFSPCLGFEIRLHGVPVRPIEWWDPSWSADHLELKVKNAKKALGIRELTPLS